MITINVLISQRTFKTGYGSITFLETKITYKEQADSYLLTNHLHKSL